MPTDEYHIKLAYDPRDAAIIKRAVGILGRQIKPLAEQVFLDHCRSVVEEDHRQHLQQAQTESTGAGRE